MEQTAFVAVGSNIAPEQAIPRGLRELLRAVTVTGSSTFFRTPAVGRPGQPDFVNGVWRVADPPPPRALKFEVLRAVEATLGRVRSADRYAPRPIDLDILLYGTVVVDEPDLTIPDPDLGVRPFLALPLLELWPDARLPGTETPIATLPSAATGRPPQMQAMPALTRRLQEILAGELAPEERRRR